MKRRSHRKADLTSLTERRSPFAFRKVSDNSKGRSEAVSVCLYKEPAYKELFPSRDFNSRFLSRKEYIKQWLDEKDLDLLIFCDKDRMEEALSFECGTVYLVSSEKNYTFEQHLWRYLGAGAGYKTVYFRGMDNIEISDAELMVYRKALEQRFEVIRAPYDPPKMTYIPIRGSCVFSGEALQFLSTFLERWSLEIPADADGKTIWHSDELFLKKWWDRFGTLFNCYTLLDREMSEEFLEDFNNHFFAGRKHIVHRIPTATSRKSKATSPGFMHSFSQFFTSP